jgi:hypothetical protein
MATTTQKQVCDKRQLITISFWNSKEITKEEKYKYIDYKQVSKITDEIITYYKADQGDDGLYYFTDLDEIKSFCKQGDNLDIILDSVISNKTVGFSLQQIIKKSSRSGITLEKNSEKQQEKQAKTLDEMCNCIGKNGVRCIWKKAKDSPFCSRHKRKEKQGKLDQFKTIDDTEDYKIDPRFQEDKEQLKEQVITTLKIMSKQQTEKIVKKANKDGHINDNQTKSLLEENNKKTPEYEADLKEYNRLIGLKRLKKDQKEKLLILKQKHNFS